MALASNRRRNGSINQFWNAFGTNIAPSLVPHCTPFGPHLGIIGPVGPMYALCGLHTHTHSTRHTPSKIALPQT